MRDVPEALAFVIRERESRIIGYASSLLALRRRPTEEQRSLMAVPLVSRGQTLGVILTGGGGWEHVFTHEDAALVSGVGAPRLAGHRQRAAVQESQQAVQAREEVLAIVSHDLRNPLNAVMLAASLLQTSDQIAPDDREQLKTIDVSAKRMQRLIEDLLDVTHLEGGKQLPIEPEPLDVQSLFAETYELFRSQAATRSITLQCRAAKDVPPVYADRHRVMQVLSNLIGNAMKFTPSGGMVHVPQRSRRTAKCSSRRRQRAGHPERKPRQHFQSLLAGQAHRAPRRRPRPADREGNRGVARRPDLGGERAGRRDEVFLHASRGSRRASAGQRAMGFLQVPAQTRVSVPRASRWFQFTFCANASAGWCGTDTLVCAVLGRIEACIRTEAR